jgi:hypothetical protein
MAHYATQAFNLDMDDFLIHSRILIDYVPAIIGRLLPGTRTTVATANGSPLPASRSTKCMKPRCFISLIFLRFSYL